METTIKNALERLGDGILLSGVQLRRDEAIEIIRYIDDLQKIIKSQQVKIEGNSNIPEKMSFLKGELNSRNINGTEYHEFARHYILPIANTPGLLRAAYAYLVEKNLRENLKRIYFVESQGGYVAVLVDELVRKDGKSEVGEMQLLDDILKNLHEI